MEQLKEGKPWSCNFTKTEGKKFIGTTLASTDDKLQ
jgi:hypothetical protein